MDIDSRFVDLQARTILSPLIVKSLLNGPEVNLVNIICENVGWHPMKKGEKVVVHFNGCEYEIVRKV